MLIVRRYRPLAGARNQIQLRLLRRSREKGVIVAAGSDSGAVGVPHGPGTVREYELLSRAGISTDRVRNGDTGTVFFVRGHRDGLFCPTLCFYFLSVI